MPVIFNSSSSLTGSIQPNLEPQQLYNFSVDFITFDNVLNENFLEAHIINAINITPQTTNNSKKFVIPLTSQSINGSPFLKIHVPQPDSSKMYITFAIKHNAMSDGYYDYINGIPSSYKSALNTWIQNLPIGGVGALGQSYYRILQFNVYGLETNQAVSAHFFEVRFKYTTSGPSSGGPVEQGGGGIQVG